MNPLSSYCFKILEVTMQPDYWHQRWRDKEIGFHQDEINPFLVKYWSKLGLEKGARVLVPLCGKSNDMLFLAARGYEIVGNELSSVAVEQFFATAGGEVKQQKIFLENSISGTDKMYLWQGEVSILQGDFFDLDKTITGDIQAVYDRAALVALPQEMRKAYVRHLISLVPDKVSILLVTLEYDQSEKAGPPFSVSELEVRQLFEPDFSVELLECLDISEEMRSVRSQNLSFFRETVYLISRQ